MTNTITTLVKHFRDPNWTAVTADAASEVRLMN